MGPADYARACVESMVRGRPTPAPPGSEVFAPRAACFVSIKKLGELRGCIGTLAPAEPDLAQEIARNASSAAFHDPRFPPVSEDELAALTYSVDVLSPSEPATAAELDPAEYGVIVTAGFRRGVLLPDLPGVDTVARQVAIALQKAGISPDEEFAIERFTVTRYRESSRADRRSCPVSVAASRPVVGLFGPTGLGKTEIADVPRRAAGWRDRLGRLHAGLPGLPLLTNQPSAAQLARVPHHLVAAVAPDVASSRWPSTRGWRTRPWTMSVAADAGSSSRAAQACTCAPPWAGLSFGTPPDTELRADSRQRLPATSAALRATLAVSRPRDRGAYRPRQPAARGACARDRAHAGSAALGRPARSPLERPDALPARPLRPGSRHARSCAGAVTSASI